MAGVLVNVLGRSPDVFVTYRVRTEAQSMPRAVPFVSGDVDDWSDVLCLFALPVVGDFREFFAAMVNGQSCKVS